MRGRHDPQVTLLAFIDLETRVPSDHPLRVIKRLADQALKVLSPDLDRMYANVGRPSIPPERLLKSSLLIALYSVRVGNQQNWDTLRPERSGVGLRSSQLPECPVVLSSPLDCLGLHFLPAS